ncbi:hypothetical protein [Brevibacillus laterosporus]|nr:hypothetical protein [Brevibacillus laterosporus]MCG7318037.1 hypothetical protein [Brevibacillus laterosporus]
MNFYQMQEIKLLNEIQEINELLATGMWKLAHERPMKYGENEYVMYRVK